MEKEKEGCLGSVDSSSNVASFRFELVDIGVFSDHEVETIQVLRCENLVRIRKLGREIERLMCAASLIWYFQIVHFAYEEKDAIICDIIYYTAVYIVVVTKAGV